MTTIDFPRQLRRFTEQHQYYESFGCSLHDVLKDLTARFPELIGTVFSEAFRPLPFIALFVDEMAITTDADLTAPLRDGARITLLNAVAGG